MGPGPSSTQRSPKRSPKRKVLHERSQSQTNRIPQRIPNDGVKPVIPSSTPYPTKAAHVLLPSSIKSRDGRSDISGASFAARIAKGKEKAHPGASQIHLGVPSTSNPNALGIKRSVSELRDLYENKPGSRPSTSHSGLSSKPSSLISSPALRGHFLGERLSNHGKFLPSELEEVSSLPSPQHPSCSIKKITSESSLPPPPTPPQSTLSEGSLEVSSSVAEGLPTTSSSPDLITPGSSSSAPDEAPALSSSPNFISLGHSSSQDFNSQAHVLNLNIAPLKLPSSPTFNPILPFSSKAIRSEHSSSPRSEPAATSSSPNVIALGSSSPNYVITKYDDSPEASVDSLRTVKKRRNEVVHEQPSTSTFSTRSEQFSSSPPEPRRFVASGSTLDSPLASGCHLESSILSENSGSRAHAELQAALGSSPVPEIQYPVVLAPRTGTWEDLVVPKRAPRFACEDDPPARWNPHLSTVLSEWSEENQLGSFHTVGTDDSSDTHSIPEMPQAAYTRDRMIDNSTTSILHDADRREATDTISALRVPQLHNKTSGLLSILSGSSRSNSMRSIILRRTNSSGSLHSVIRFPAWARRYYSRGPSDSFYSLPLDISSSNLCQPSLPSTALNPPTIQPPSHSLFRPRTRGGKNARESHMLPGIGPLVSNPSQHRLSSLALHPADPRSHWAGAERSALQGELNHQPPVGSRFANPWSPHLFPDNRASGRNRWLAPSINDTGAPIFTLRNAHMLGFMLGFVFPVSWFIAAFLPLPAKPVMKEVVQDPEVGGLTLQEQLDRQTTIGEEIRYTSLRWWRNLNRFMSIVGLVVIAIIITLAVIGTRRGFSPR
ncbi:hypothetical protein EPUS_08374 [Endocarpon pusillum Z07020]|uniref:Serine-rich protein n=1 Tax=Endocarpon pusillum (strain Z07020 / HMAS-L-300199) TaxID=1263415 RepID=U1G6C8_ENDPU|nr:uncharacterized protein EPUS_08374 [Endocarpon pusillum Z07020]ERF72927.1 hypothetical protein EPUS_08374 [Endocarpon pusillum Z07020]